MLRKLILIVPFWILSCLESESIVVLNDQNKSVRIQIDSNTCESIQQVEPNQIVCFSPYYSHPKEQISHISFQWQLNNQISVLDTFCINSDSIEASVQIIHMLATDNEGYQSLDSCQFIRNKTPEFSTNLNDYYPLNYDSIPASFPLGILLKWKAFDQEDVGLEYEIHISNTNNFSDTISVINDLEYTIGNPLESNQLYSWYIIAKDHFGATNTSDTFHFFIRAQWDKAWTVAGNVWEFNEVLWPDIKVYAIGNNQDTLFKSINLDGQFMFEFGHNISPLIIGIKYPSTKTNEYPVFLSDLKGVYISGKWRKND